MYAKLALFLCGLLAVSDASSAETRVVVRPDAAERFATLPDGAAFPEGIGKDRAAKGLLFPASPMIVGGKIYVTNLALPLTSDVIGDEPEEDVTRYTISEIDLDDRDDDDHSH